MPEWLTLTNETARPIAKYCEGHAGRPRRLTEFDLPGNRAPPTPGTSGEGGHPIVTTATAITTVVSHPSHLSTPVTTNCPSTSRRVAKYIMIPMTGTATMPLITAVQTSAFIGFIGVKLNRPDHGREHDCSVEGFCFHGLSRQPGGPA